eukprot:CAMPEP_0184326656 /NCGR_PEP_ID=MMETSP1049-20130417/142675_1 /TAXON_ID=77928 /ORGANISM="Proteomonas sulcata, Strain CCMP704" /LENGTH=144 /DNA_ID=CAMNT_0026648859 /DNA_START=983 /DNA_END=1415 /DNA_ORIENTATION=+
MKKGAASAPEASAPDTGSYEPPGYPGMQEPGNIPAGVPIGKTSNSNVPVATPIPTAQPYDPTNATPMNQYHGGAAMGAAAPPMGNPVWGEHADVAEDVAFRSFGSHMSSPKRLSGLGAQNATRILRFTSHVQFLKKRRSQGAKW